MSGEPHPDGFEDPRSPRRWGTSHFELGDHDALIGPLTLGLVEAGHPTTRERLWKLVESMASLDDILDGLSSAGLRSLPSFGVAFEDGVGLRVVARGAARARVTQRDGRVDIVDPSDVRTWLEEFFEDVATVELRIVPEGAASEAWPPIDARYFVLAGAVPAARVVRDYVTDAVLATRAEADWERVDAIVAPDRVEPEPDPELVESEAFEPEAVDPTPASPPAADAFGFSSPPAPNTATDAQPAPPATVPAASAPLEPATAEPASPASDDQVGEELFDIELARSAPSVLISSVPTLASSSEVAGPLDTFDADSASDETIELPHDERSVRSNGEPAADAPPISDPGLSAPLLWESDVAPSDRAVNDDVDDLDSLTISREDLRKRRVRAPALALPGPLEVHALVCTCGQANPPTRGDCRACGAVLTGDVLQVVDRPTLAVLEFSNGDHVPVDRSVLIGRNPKVEQRHAGELPRIVRIEDDGGLSRTHAQVRVEGWDMLLEDLHSRNGTSVTLPGKPARRLHPGEPVILEVGAVIEFDDELHCTVRAEQ